MTTSTLTDMIAAAQRRQAVIEQERATDRERRQRESCKHFRERLAEFFGDIPAMLDMVVETSDHGSLSALFRHEGRGYSLREGRDIWWLTRLDARDEDDDRELPRDEFWASFRDSLQERQDRFLLSLSDLSKQPDTPIKQPTKHEPEPEPTLEERLVLVLREFIHAEAGN